MYLTIEQLDAEIREKDADLLAFRQAYNLIHGRMKETEINNSGLVTPLHTWSGAIGLKNIMEPLLNAMQRMADELKEIRRREFPEAVDPSKPVTFRVVE